MTDQSGKSGTNRMAVPEAKSAMNRFKEEVASELGVSLKEGYNGDLTSRQAGSIGGEMVKKSEKMMGLSGRFGWTASFFCVILLKCL